MGVFWIKKETWDKNSVCFEFEKKGGTKRVYFELKEKHGAKKSVFWI
jgi:hypothetical protein